MIARLEINRLHWLLFVLWQIALVFCTQQIFPVFYNYSPRLDCDEFNIYANSSECSLSKKYVCKALEKCDLIRVDSDPPFHSAVEEFKLFCDRDAYYATVVSTVQFLGVLFGTIIYGHLGDYFGRRMVSIFGVSLGILCGVASATALVVSPVPLVAILLLPESPKWLISNGKEKEARSACRKLQYFAGDETLFNEDLNQQSGGHRVHTMKDLLTDRTIAKRTVVLCVLWFSTSLSAFGSDLNSGNLAGNFYANQFVSAAVTAFAKIFVFILDEKLPTFDRRKLYYYPQILVIVCYAAIMFLLAFVKEDDCDEDYWANWAVIIINIIGVSLIEITWDACYLVAVECFPTHIRTIGMGTCSLLARCGALLAPQMAYLSSISRWAPYGVVVAIGCFSLVIAIFFLPDTKGVDLGNMEKKDKEPIN